MNYFFGGKPFSKLFIAFIISPVICNKFCCNFYFSFPVVNILPPNFMENVKQHHCYYDQDIDDESSQEKSIFSPIHGIGLIILEPNSQGVNHCEKSQSCFNVDQYFYEVDCVCLRNFLIDGGEEGYKSQGNSSDDCHSIC